MVHSFILASSLLPASSSSSRDWKVKQGEEKEKAIAIFCSSLCIQIGKRLDIPFLLWILQSRMRHQLEKPEKEARSDSSVPRSAVIPVTIQSVSLTLSGEVDVGTPSFNSQGLLVSNSGRKIRGRLEWKYLNGKVLFWWSEGPLKSYFSIISGSALNFHSSLNHSQYPDWS